MNYKPLQNILKIWVQAIRVGNEDLKISSQSRKFLFEDLKS